MGVFKNGVGRPSNETIKKRNIFKGICVLLVLIIIGMTVYILNDKGIINISSKDDKKTVDKKTNKDTTKESEKNQTTKNEFENYFVKSEFKEVNGQNCTLSINDDGSLYLRTNFRIEEYNHDVKVNGLEEKAKYLAVFNFANDASEDFAVLTENNNLYIARFYDSDTEINFKKIDVGNKKIESLMTSDKTNEFVDGYVKFKDKETLSKIVYDCSSNGCTHKISK